MDISADQAYLLQCRWAQQCTWEAGREREMRGVLGNSVIWALEGCGRCPPGRDERDKNAWWDNPAGRSQCRRRPGTKAVPGAAQSGTLDTEAAQANRRHWSAVGEPRHTFKPCCSLPGQAGCFIPSVQPPPIPRLDQIKLIYISGPTSWRLPHGLADVTNRSLIQLDSEAPGRESQHHHKPAAPLCSVPDLENRTLPSTDRQAEVPGG